MKIKIKKLIPMILIGIISISVFVLSNTSVLASVYPEITNNSEYQAALAEEKYLRNQATYDNGQMEKGSEYFNSLVAAIRKYEKELENQKINKYYTVTFTDGMGRILKTEEVRHGASATAPSVPSKAGYTFVGWDNNAAVVQGDMTVNAQWKKDKDNTGGDAGNNSSSVSKGTKPSQTIFFKAPVKVDIVFHYKNLVEYVEGEMNQSGEATTNFVSVGGVSNKAATRLNYAYKGDTYVEPPENANNINWKFKNGKTVFKENNIVKISYDEFDENGYLERSLYNNGVHGGKIDLYAENMYVEIKSIDKYTPEGERILSCRLGVWDSLTLNAVFYPTENKDKKVKFWRSSNENVATVSSKGISSGTAIIYATTNTGNTVETTIVVADQYNNYCYYYVALDKGAISVQEGEKKQLDISPFVTDNGITFTSSNTEVVTVDVNGTIKAIKPGYADITVKSNDGRNKYAICEVTVKSKTIALKGVSLNKKKAEITEGNFVKLTATLSPANVTNKGVTWSSSNTGVATVDAKGNVKGIKPGTATITVKTKDSAKTATCKVTVKAKTVAVTGVKLNKTTATVTAGSTLKLTSTVSPANATNKAVTWSSNNTKVATVDSNGNVKGIKPGTATITVKTKDGGKTATCKVTVKAKTVAVTGVKLNKTTATVTAGSTLKLTSTVSPANATNKTVTWSSSNTGVAKVDANGNVKAVKPGTATITVKTKDGAKTATCKVTVKAKNVPVTGIKLNSTNETLTKNSTLKLTPTVSPSNATDKGVTLTSSNTSVATVDGNGNVKAVNPGTATITVKTKDGGKTANCKITVDEIWKRLWGQGCYDTMKAIIDEGFTKTGGTVVVATGTNFQDALAASGLAGLENAPVVLTDGKTLSTQAKDVLKRLKTKKIYVAGGPYAVSEKVVSSIKSATGTAPKRLYGQDSADTSAKLALAGKGRWKDGTAIIATNRSFYDAMSIAPIAYAKNYPGLLASNGTSLNKSVTDAMKKLGIKNVIIVGGKAAVTDNVEKQLKSAGMKIKTRLWGNNAVETSKKIAEWGIKNGLNANKMGVATSQNFPDALAGAALCGKNRSVLVLADDQANLNATFPKAYKKTISRGYVFGGKYAVGEKTLNTLENSVK